MIANQKEITSLRSTIMAELDGDESEREESHLDKLAAPKSITGGLGAAVAA